MLAGIRRGARSTRTDPPRVRSVLTARRTSAPRMFLVGIASWLRRLFSATEPEDEAAKRDEYGTSDRGQMKLERDRFGSFAEGEGTRAAEDELEEFEPPRDPAP